MLFIGADPMTLTLQAIIMEGYDREWEAYGYPSCRAITCSAVQRKDPYDGRDGRSNRDFADYPAVVLINSLIALPSFKKHFGVELKNGTYQLQASWQSALSRS